MLNAIGCPAVQGVPLSDLAPKGLSHRNLDDLPVSDRAGGAA
jgi:hypothetical protein